MKLGSIGDWNELSFSRKPDDSVPSEVEGWRNSAFLRLDWQITPSFGLEAGADSDRRESPRYQTLTTAMGVVTSENNMKDRSVREQSYYLQGKWSAGGWNLLGGSL